MFIRKSATVKICECLLAFGCLKAFSFNKTHNIMNDDSSQNSFNAAGFRIKKSPLQRGKTEAQPPTKLLYAEPSYYLDG